MSEIDEPTGPHRTASLSLWRIAAVAASASAALAVLTASQTYLTMLSHGHSFARLLLWQLGCWGFWAMVQCPSCSELSASWVASFCSVRTRRHQKQHWKR